MYRTSSTQMLKFSFLARYLAAVFCAEECSQPSRIFQNHVQVAPCGRELLSYLKIGLPGGHRIALLEAYCQCNSYDRCVWRNGCANTRIF
jgi:hypothetical protein